MACFAMNPAEAELYARLTVIEADLAAYKRAMFDRAYPPGHADRDRFDEAFPPGHPERPERIDRIRRGATIAQAMAA